MTLLAVVLVILGNVGTYALLLAILVWLRRNLIQRTKRASKAPVLRISLITTGTSYAALAACILWLEFSNIDERNFTEHEPENERPQSVTLDIDATASDIELASPRAELFEHENKLYVTFDDVPIPSGGFFNQPLFETGGFLLGPEPDGVDIAGDNYFIYGWPLGDFECEYDPRNRVGGGAVAAPMRYNASLNMEEMTLRIDGFYETRAGRERVVRRFELRTDGADPTFFKTQNHRGDEAFMARYQARSSINQYRRQGRDLFRLTVHVQNTVNIERYTCVVPLNN